MSDFEKFYILEHCMFVLLRNYSFLELQLEMAHNVTYEAFTPAFVVTLAIEAVMVILIIPANLLTIVAVIRFPSLQTITNRFIVNLSVAGVLLGLMVPIHLALVVTESWGQDQKYLCIGRFFSLLMPGSACLLSLTIITIDRYIAVFYSLQYHSIMTSKVSILLLIPVWIIPFILSFALFFWNTWPEVGIIECLLYKVAPIYFVIFVQDIPFGIIIVINFILYFKIFHQASIQNKKIATDCPTIPKVVLLQKDAKRAKTLVIVLGSIVVCWLPFFFIVTSAYFLIKWYTSYLYFGSVVFAVSNASLNPLVYSWRNQEFRTAYKKILVSMCQCCINTNTVVQPMSPSPSVPSLNLPNRSEISSCGTPTQDVFTTSSA